MTESVEIKEIKKELKLPSNELNLYLKTLKIEKNEKITKEQKEKIVELKEKTRLKMLPASMFFPGTNKIYNLISELGIETKKIKKPSQISFITFNDIKKIENHIKQKLPKEYEPNVLKEKAIKEIRKIQKTLCLSDREFSMFLKTSFRHSIRFSLVDERMDSNTKSHP